MNKAEVLAAPLRQRGFAALPPLLWPALAFLLVFYAVPLINVLKLSVLEPAPGLQHFVHMAEVAIYPKILLTTFEISFVVALLCLLLGYPTAYLLVTAPARWSRLLMILVIVPFFTSLLVRNYCWIFLLGANGIINATLQGLGVTEAPVRLIYNRFGVLIGMVHVLLPYMILVLAAQMRGIDLGLTRAASSLVAPPFTAFRRVFLPLSLPGVAAGFLLVFLISIAFFVTPAMLGGPRETMIANIIASKVGFLEWGFASALSVVLLVVSLALIAAIQAFFGGFSIIAPGLRSARQRRARTWEGPLTWTLDKMLNPIWPYLPPLVGAFVLAFLVLPVVLMVPISLSPLEYFVFPPPGLSLRWYAEYFNSPAWISATFNSLKVGLITVALTLAIALPAALAISRSRSRLAALSYGVILSPMVVPGIIVAIAVFFLFSRIGLTGTIWGVALGHTVGALPFATIVLVAALQNFDRNLERAALSLGASPLRTLQRVTLPVIRPAVITAAFLSFLYSFDEILVSIFVSGIRARTLPKKMWESLQEVDPTIAAVSTLLILFTVALLSLLYLASGRLARRPAARG